ncbi:MAG TPA: 4'-phosphopantetheinyl transferase [Cyanobacteria bacterium UBA11049]|nr:4'-phosphopantetheinyl transferase [Cyanobacteria bacterium UBA11049]
MSKIDRQWCSPPKSLKLSRNDVHVWRATLDRPAECVCQLAQSLSDDERLRAERFYFERDRSRFIVGRGLLRFILSRYLEIAANKLQFCYSSRGKPELIETSREYKLRFNVSHSQEIVLYAVTRDRSIGIDVEYIRPLPEAEQIVKSFFSLYEKSVFERLPPDQKQLAFFNCWTRKEAFVKAIGDGLSLPLDRFDVSLIPGEPARLLGIKGDNRALDHLRHRTCSNWSLQDITPIPGYVAALAVEGQSWNLSYWEWQEEG